MGKIDVTQSEITVNGVAYVPKGSAQTASRDGLPYVVVRTTSAGAFIGYLKSRTGDEAEMVKARRLWYWSGAASLSQLALDGVSKPGECRFPEAVDVTLLGVVEVISATEKARVSVEGVPVWRA